MREPFGRHLIAWLCVAFALACLARVARSDGSIRFGPNDWPFDAEVASFANPFDQHHTPTISDALEFLDILDSNTPVPTASGVHGIDNSASTASAPVPPSPASPSSPSSSSSSPSASSAGLATFNKYYTGYGYPNSSVNFASLREKELSHLRGQIYLDYTGSSLYQISQLRNATEDLSQHLYGNAHSNSACSRETEEHVEKVRKEILAFFNASSEEYAVIFTSGATAALKLVGENFVWSKSSHFTHLLQNHNSVLGIRTYALRAGADSRTVTEAELEAALAKKNAAPQQQQQQQQTPQKQKGKYEPGSTTPMPAPASVQRARSVSSPRFEEELLQPTPAPSSALPATQAPPTYHLFAYPAESNFDGAKYSLEWIQAVQNGLLNDMYGEKNQAGNVWMVVLDAAAFVPTHPLDLSRYHPDFVDISFYKIFGYPTGMGCLLVRKKSAAALHKVYFGGGTVVASTSRTNFHQLRHGLSEQFEDGTIDFLGIISLSYGLRAISAFGLPSIASHTSALVRYLYTELASLRHKAGQAGKVVEIYGNHEAVLGAAPSHSQQSDAALAAKHLASQGPIVSFNVLDVNGKYVPWHQVVEKANEKKINLRAGCHCNPGACLGVVNAEESEFIRLVKEKKEAHKCTEGPDFVNGKAVGAVRCSLGFGTSFDDVEKMIDFIRSVYVDYNLHPAGSGVSSTPAPTSAVLQRPSTPIWKLQANNFDSVVSHRYHEGGKPVSLLVEYYSPTCPHCVKFAPTYAKVSEWASANVRDKLVVAQVDCKANYGLCDAQKIRGYPTMLFYPAPAPGSTTLPASIEVTGPREEAALIKWIKHRVAHQA